MFYDERLQEPRKYYDEYLKDKFKEMALHYFYKLTEESKISIDENQNLVAKYKDEEEKLNFIQKKYSKNKFLNSSITKVIFIILVLFVIFFFSIDNYDVKTIAGISFFVILFILFLYLKFIVLKNKIKEIETEKEEVEKKANSLKKSCFESVENLNNLFHSEMTLDLIRESIPFINIDKSFNIRRFEQLVKNYGFTERTNNNCSTLDLISGDILGNPFIITKNLKHKWIKKAYSNSITISYEEHYTDSEGKRQTRTVYETLTATVYKDAPEYSEEIYLIYGNDAAENLSFSRQPQERSEKKSFIGKAFNNLFNVDSNRAKLKKIQDEAEKKGRNFQPMSNEEFELTFGAFDRDNETEFRLLFTPLAQENILDLAKNSPFKDHFIFFKNKKINKVTMPINKYWKIENDPKSYKFFDYNKIKEHFINSNSDYFEYLFFNFAPLLSIPLYQQMQSQEYIYKKSFNYNYNAYVTEMLANNMNVSLFAHNDTNTRTILKTNFEDIDGDRELIKVTAHSYRTVQRYDIVSKRGGDGKYYDITVYWIEYIPIKKETLMEVCEFDKKEKEYNDVKYQNNFKKIFDDTCIYKHNLFGTIFNGDDSSKVKILKKLIN